MATGKDKPDRDDRRQQKLWALQDRSPACLACGETDERCLERHHIAGRKHHEDLVVLCRNCHRKASDMQIDHFPFNRPEPRNELAIIGFYLLGLSDIHEMRRDQLRQFGIKLIELSEEKEE